MPNREGIGGDSDSEMSGEEGDCGVLFWGTA